MADSSSPVSAFSGALRPEQHDRGDHQRQRAEQAEEGVDEDMRVLAVERVGVDAREGDDPVRRVRPAGSRVPACRGTVPAGPSRRGFRSPSRPTSATAALISAPRRTLAQNSLRASTRNATAAMWKARPMTSPMSSCIQVSSPVDEVVDVPDDRRDHVEDEDQPGDALCGPPARRPAAPARTPTRSWCRGS